MNARLNLLAYMDWIFCSFFIPWLKGDMSNAPGEGVEGGGAKMSADRDASRDSTDYFGWSRLA